MFLNRDEINAALESERLTVDPVVSDTQIGFQSIDLRMGKQFLRVGPESGIPSAFQVSANDLELARSALEPRSAELGEAVDLSPGSSLLITSLEYIDMGQDLVGLLSLRGGFSRVGLSGNTSIVNSRFQGKITFLVSNLGGFVARLYPGMSVLKLALAHFSGSDSRSPHSAPEDSDLSEPDETVMEKLKSLTEGEQQSQSVSDSAQRAKLRQLFDSALNVEADKKGKALEDFAVKAFQVADGLNVIKRNGRTATGELDIVIKNNLPQDTPFWRNTSSPIIVECKNWSQSVGAREISVLVNKLRDIGPDAQTGILIAPNGISGDRRTGRDAFQKIADERRRGKKIVVLDLDSLESIADGASIASVIEAQSDRSVFY